MPDEKNDTDTQTMREKLAHGTLRAYFPVLAAVVTTAGIAYGPSLLRSNSVELSGLELSPLEIEKLRQKIREDPFTGTQGAALRAELIAKIEELEDEQDATNRRLDKLPPRKLTERVRVLELRADDADEDVQACCPRGK